MKKQPLAVRLHVGIRDTLAAITDPLLFLWCIYTILTPLYIFPSGLPQPGDMLIVVLAPVVILPFGLKLFKRAKQCLRLLILFTLFVCVENIVWSFLLSEWSMNLKIGTWWSSVFYIYNLLVFWITVAMYQRYRLTMLRLTYRTLYAATLGIVLLSPFFMRSRLRQSLLFNSPNQLGYHAVLAATVMILMQVPLGISTVQTSIGLVACAYLALLSSSKAALAGIAMLAAVGLINKPRMMILTTLLGSVLFVYSAAVGDAVDKAEFRVEHDRTYGFAEERGYDRITGHPEYIVLGSGEGAYERFADTTVIKAHEIHSSFGTLVFCYGVPGVLLFAWFCLVLLRRSSWKIWLICAPAFSFGFTHQALRTTLFWVLLAIVLALQHLQSVTNATRGAPTKRVAPQPARRPMNIRPGSGPQSISS